MNHKVYKKVVLVVCDGFGVASPSRGNAVTVAGTPNLDNLIAFYPAATLRASGLLVGLPVGEPGNSEVGHLSIGAGRVVGQDMPRITASIQDGSFFQNEAFLSAVEHVKKNNSRLHLVGLLSNGGVHSLDEHLYALLGLAQRHGIQNVVVHAFTDGRDTAPKAALEAFGKLEMEITKIGAGRVASITGRFYAMDRGGHWQQTLSTLDAIFFGKGNISNSSAEAVSSAYAAGLTDEMIPPTVIVDGGAPVGLVSENDALIFFNFRQDRMVQIATALSAINKTPISDKFHPPKNLLVVTMTEYTAGLPVLVAFGQMSVKNNLAEVVAAAGLKQMHIAEREKYAHVTTFFNCGNLSLLPGEERLIIDSPEDNSSSYANVPAMSARELADALIADVTKSDKNFFVANFANADMVGHTGNLNSAVQAVKVLDECLGKVAEACLLVDAALLITADHGNIEEMLDLRSGDPDTDHTSNPVPIILIANEWKRIQPLSFGYQDLASLVPVGMIADVAPTVLSLFGLQTPEEMRAVDLLGMI